MESNDNYVIMATIDWHRVACIAYFVTSNYIFFAENCWSVCGFDTLKQLMLSEKSSFWSSKKRTQRSDVNKARPLKAKAKAKAKFPRPSHNAKACDKR